MDDHQVPLTPVGRICMRPEHDSVILCAIGFENTINIEALKAEISGFILAKIPRFSSLVVYDKFDGSANWKPTQVNVDDHVLVHSDDDGEFSGEDTDTDTVNSYLAGMVMSSPMSLDKPLWEMHVMPKHNFMIMRVHHALADGMSLMSMLWSMGRPKRDQTMHGDGVINGGVKRGEKVEKNSDYTNVFAKMGRRIWGFFVYIWYRLMFWLNYFTRFMRLKDEVEKICGGKKVDLSRRNVATATFSIADMKSIKKDIPNATIHDILYGIVWCGLTRYINGRYPQALKDGTRLTGLCPVNVREPPGLQDLSTMQWGNKISMILLPITHYTKQQDMEALAYVKRAKSVMDKKKRSMEAPLSYKFECLLAKLIGSKIPSQYLAKFFKNSTFILSNILGPPEQISIAGNPVSFIRLTASINNPQALTMHMVSYMGRANLQVQVAKEIFTDTEFLVNCFENSLFDMINVAQGDSMV